MTLHIETTDTNLARALRDEFDGAASPEQLARLGAAFGARAEEAGLVDVAVRALDSPIGELLVAVTPRGVVRVAFACEGHDHVLEELAAQVSPRILSGVARTDRVARELDEYFAGSRQHFDLDVDLQLLGGFRRRVVASLADIGYGHTASYGVLAAGLDNPGASRAVGSACAHNPVPIILPCHRVVRSDGTIGNYRGGTDAKRALLAMEAAHT